jgi:hypothetical protein
MAPPASRCGEPDYPDLAQNASEPLLGTSHEVVAIILIWPYIHF